MSSDVDLEKIKCLENEVMDLTEKLETIKVKRAEDRSKLKEDEKVDKLLLYFKRHTNSTLTPSGVNVMAKINNTRVFKSSIDLRSSYNNWLKVRLPRVLSRKINLYAKNIDVNKSVDVDLRLKFRQPAVFKGTPYLSLPKLQRQSQHMISDFSKKNKAPKCIGQCCLQQLELDSIVQYI